MPEKENVAPCGVYCEGCVVYKASDNPHLAEAIAENMDVRPEEAQCDGCRSEDGIISVLSTDEVCPTYECVQDKGVEFCYECDDYPCAKLYSCQNSPPPHNSKINNLTLIENEGLDWFLDNAERLTEMYYNGIKEHGGSALKLETGD